MEWWLPGGNGELLFNGYRVLVLKMTRVLKIGCMKC